MKIFSPPCFRYLLPACFGLSMLTACAYQRPAGHWLTLETPVIYFPAVTLDEKAIDRNYEAVCKAAQSEINHRLSRELAAKITPLRLVTGQAGSTIDSNSADSNAAVLKLSIKRCEIDVDQSAGSFTYYLTLPVNVSLTQNGKTLLDYRMQTYEQVTIDNPAPEFEFTFAEPVSRTLSLFNGRQLWLPDN